VIIPYSTRSSSMVLTSCWFYRVQSFFIFCQLSIHIFPTLFYLILLIVFLFPS